MTMQSALLPQISRLSASKQLMDRVAYECMPAPHSPSMHEVFLSGWGLPIGELFDLRELAKACEERGNWSFLFTSMPLYVNGGIASPPNAQAIL